MRISAFYEIAKYYFRSHMPHADAIFQNLYNNLYIYIVFLGGFGYAFASKRIRLRGLPIGSEADTAGGCAIARAGNTRNKSPFGACRRRSGGFSDHATPRSAAAHPQIGKNKKKRLAANRLYSLSIKSDRDSRLYSLSIKPATNADTAAHAVRRQITDKSRNYAGSVGTFAV